MRDGGKERRDGDPGADEIADADRETSLLEHGVDCRDPLNIVDPIRDFGVDPVAYWAERYPDPYLRKAALAGMLEDALRAPRAPADLCAQFVGGRGAGLLRIRRAIVQSPISRYSALPISDSEATALIGHGRYFEPLYSVEPPILCQCIPLQAPPSKTFRPPNGLVRRLRVLAAYR